MQFENELLVDEQHLLVGHILELASLHVNDDLDLVDALLVAVLCAVREFDAPRVLQLLDEKVRQQVNRIVHCTH